MTVMMTVTITMITTNLSWVVRRGSLPAGGALLELLGVEEHRAVLPECEDRVGTRSCLRGERCRIASLQEVLRAVRLVEVDERARFLSHDAHAGDGRNLAQYGHGQGWRRSQARQLGTA